MKPSMDTAPKDGSIFLAFYDSKFGPAIGPMFYEPRTNKKGEDVGAFLSTSILTESQKAYGWISMEEALKLLS